MRVHIPKSKAATYSNGRWSGGGEQKDPEELTRNGRLQTHNQLRKSAVRKVKQA